MKLLPFVPFATYNSTNGFGQYDPQYYPMTKHHLGSDFRVQIGTGIIAPADGEMLKNSFNAARGNTGIFVFPFEGREWGLELCHLHVRPPLGRFRAGQQIAISGNTGSATTGSHLHVTLHRDATVTKNYTELTDETAFLRLWREGRLLDPYLWFWQRINL